MPIREFFHLMHLVGDHDQVHDQYAKLLAPRDWGPKSWSPFDKRWATLGCVGPDFVLEIMEPSREQDDLQAPLPKFWHRHGDHLHSFSWYVDPVDMAPLMARIADLGVKVLTPYDAADPDNPMRTFFTHPKGSFGQLEFQSLPDVDSDRDFHLHPDWSGDFWRYDFPAGIERSSHLTLVVADVEAAQAFYAKGLDAPSFHEEESHDRLSSFCFVGTETVIELAQPKSETSWIGRDLESHGNIPHAATFKVADLAAAEKHVASSGMSVAWRSDDTIVVDPATLGNAVIGFTNRVIPGDPRD